MLSQIFQYGEDFSRQRESQFVKAVQTRYELIPSVPTIFSITYVISQKIVIH